MAGRSGSKHIPATLLHPTIKASRADVRTLFFTTENQAREHIARASLDGPVRDEDLSVVWARRAPAPAEAANGAEKGGGGLSALSAFAPVVPGGRPSIDAGSSRSSRASSRPLRNDWTESSYAQEFRRPAKKWYRREPPLRTNAASSSVWVEEPDSSHFITATHAMLAEGQRRPVLQTSGRYKTAGLMGLLYPIDEIPIANIKADRKRSVGLLF